MISAIISRLVILVFGTLYPAYASYKAVKTKNLKEYVKWMMYWIVFALFTCTETFTDVFLSWFPFYYEVKIVLVLWLLSPATKGSSILYRKFVHPALCRREQEIDEYISKAKDQGYHTVLNLGTKGVNYATTVIMQTAIKGGGGLVQQIRKSYSLSDLTECDVRDEHSADETDDVLTEPRHVRRVVKPGYRRSASESNSRSQMYFPEVDVDVRGTHRMEGPDLSHIKSTEDISSGYSSADNSGSLTRTASVGASARAKVRPSRNAVTSIKRPQAAEEREVSIEELHDAGPYDYSNMPPLVGVQTPLFISHTNPPFIYQYNENEIRILKVLGNCPLSLESDEIHPDQINHTKDTMNKDTQISNVSKCNDSKSEYSSIVLESHIEQPTVQIIEFDESVHIGKLIEDNDAHFENERYENENLDTQTSTKRPDINVVFVQDSHESDDETLFRTPDGSPKSERKIPKGKYGKDKAPLPPNILMPQEPNNFSDLEINMPVQETFSKLLEALPIENFRETRLLKTAHNVINPIAEKKMRNKLKSTRRLQKQSPSGITKLLQLPTKLAFWTTAEDCCKSECTSDNINISSNFEENVDNFQSCVDLGNSISNKASSVGNEDICNSDVDVACENETKTSTQHTIMEKSEALKKVIDAKLEVFPEYKVAAHEEIPTTSKSTDV